MAHFKWYLDPSSLIKLKKSKKKKKNVVKVGPPLTKLSGSAHDVFKQITKGNHFLSNSIIREGWTIVLKVLNRFKFTKYTTCDSDSKKQQLQNHLSRLQMEIISFVILL